MKKINLKKVFRGRNVAFSLLIFAVVFLVGHTASAAIGDWAGEVVGGIIGLFIKAVAQILILLVGVLMDVASYSNFINAGAVAKGWIVVRDLCNMFFVVILLIIAFATILGQEEYGAKKMLPKLIMAAVLINFSKLFCGLMIDIASVVMLTFVNAFSAIGSGNILDLLGISKVMQVDTNATVSFSTIVSAYIFGLIYVLIATVVIASMLGMLVMRIVMIWILVVLSPLAFFLQAVPGKGQQYASQWWTKWSSNLIVGPVIAFFLWLSFAALQGDGSPIIASNVDPAVIAAASTASTTPLGSEAGTPAQMAKFVIAIGMLLGGMKIAQEVGGEAGSALGKGMAQINKGRALAVGAATGLAVGAVKGTAKLAGRSTLGIVSQIDKGLSGSQGGERKTWAGKLAKGWGDDLQASSKKNRKAAAAKYLGNLGMGEKTAVAGQAVIASRGFQTTANTIKGGLIGATVGTAVGPLGTVVGLLSGIAAGYASANEKGNRQDTVKNYENAKANHDQAEGEYSAAQKNLAEHTGHEANVDEFEKNENVMANYKGPTGVAIVSPSQRQARDEYDAAKSFVNNKNNIKNNEDGTKYLKDTKTTLQEKQVAVQSADQKRQDNPLPSGDDKIKYDKAVKTGGSFIVSGTDKLLDRFSAPKAAMADMTKKQAAARDWVSSNSGAKDILATSGSKGSIYGSSGLSEVWKNRLDELNKGGGSNDAVLNSLVDEIKTISDPAKLTELSKAFSAYKGGGAKVNAGTLGRVEDGLTNRGEDPIKYPKALRNYKAFDKTKMDINPGSGSLQYDTFARNSSKNPVDRKAEKDIMGVSFDKINQRAKDKGIDYKLDDAAGVNQKVDGPKLKELGDVMSSLIDDEIKALQATGAAANSREIGQLNVVKSRLADNNFSGISLKNTDVSYASRQDEYNSTQHEIMHQSGAKDEAMVNASASALQDAKLYGSVPKSNLESGGKRYDEIIGKMIANMENSGAGSEAMSQSVVDQIKKWQVPNAQRVVETEKGERETVADIVPDTGKNSEEIFEKTNEAIDKLTDSLSKPIKSFDGGRVGAKNLSTSDQNFFRAMFGGLKKVITKDDKVIGEKLSPLAAMATESEKK